MRLVGSGVRTMSHWKVTVCLIAVGALVISPRVTAAQNLRELAIEQARKDPAVALEQTAAPSAYRHKTIDELTK